MAKKIASRILRCACGSPKCNKPIIEYFHSEQYPKGAYRLIDRHGRKEPCSNILDLTKPSEQPLAEVHPRS